MKDLKVSNETHSLLFSLKCKKQLHTYDEVLKFLISYHHNFIPLDVMYQLEEKP